jgi:glycosyltransferase involved in cell wall biosynthesis
MKIGVLLVNRNNLKYTVDAIVDLSKQNTKDFEVVIIDNGSTEVKTKKKLHELKSKHSFITHLSYTEKNEPLNHLWNRFIESKDCEYYCFLNNDVRLPHNFLSDNIKILDKEDGVGCVIHSTNHSDYQTVTDLKYEIFDGKYRQGWDYTIRKEAYTKIPNQLHFFCGDDFIYENMYKNKWKIAVAYSSPIIHYCAKTPRIPGVSNRDIAAYKKLGYTHPNLKICSKYCNNKPTFNKIIEIQWT